MAKRSSAKARLIFSIGDGGGTCPGALDGAAYLRTMREEVTAANAGTTLLHVILPSPTSGPARVHLDELTALNGGQVFEAF